MKNLLLIAFCISICSMSLFAQDTLFNQTDSQGLKQGYWKKYYPNGNVQYIGFFLDNKPVGEMKRYFEDGGLKIKMTFSDATDEAYAEMYYQNKALAADGKYVGRLKDSTWNYYSYYDKTITLTEKYDKGKRTGESQKFYVNGLVSESIFWQNDKKEGQWKQFFLDGSKKLEASYKNNWLSGLFIMYYPSGEKEIEGSYVNNKKHGTWTYYNEEGEVKLEVMYENGYAKNQEVLDAKQKEYFDEMETNIGLIQEPTIEDLIPGMNQ